MIRSTINYFYRNTNSDWWLYCVLASLSPVIIRFIAYWFHQALGYDNLDMLYAGFALNLACLNIIKARKVNRRRVAVNMDMRVKIISTISLVMLVLIVIFIAFTYSAKHMSELSAPLTGGFNENQDNGKTLAFCGCTLGSLIISFYGNKSVLDSVNKSPSTSA